MREARLAHEYFMSRSSSKYASKSGKQLGAHALFWSPQTPRHVKSALLLCPVSPGGSGEQRRRRRQSRAWPSFSGVTPHPLHPPTHPPSQTQDAECQTWRQWLPCLQSLVRPSWRLNPRPLSHSSSNIGGLLMLNTQDDFENGAGSLSKYSF